MSPKNLLAAAVLTLALPSTLLRAQPEPNGHTLAAAADVELSPREIYQKEGPAVVLIMTADAAGKGELGTGSVIDADGRVITNAHVVIDAATGEPYERIHVYFKPARLTGDSQKDLTDPSQARVLQFDRKLDLALLELKQKPAKLSVMPVGDSSRVEAGEPVVAIGHPEQGGLWTLTTGVVSTIIADLDDVPGKDVFQTDASINRGNSGGPLISRRGEMIGINTSIARKGEDGLAITSVNFSIKSDVVKAWLAHSGTEVALTEAAPAPTASAAVPVAASQPAPADQPALAPSTATPSAAPPAEPAPKPVPAPKAAIVTPAKPYKIEDLREKEMAEMEDLEKEMHDEVERKSREFNSQQPAPTPPVPDVP